MWSDSENRPAAVASPARWREPLLFVATLFVATLLYLATKRPALAAILPCLHGGYENGTVACASGGYQLVSMSGLA